jgi:hypothetical protein
MRNIIIAACAGAASAFLSSTPAVAAETSAIKCYIRTHVEGADFSTDPIYFFPSMSLEPSQANDKLRRTIASALKAHMLKELNVPRIEGDCNWYKSIEHAEYQNRDTGPRFRRLDWPFDPLNPANETAKAATPSKLSERGKAPPPNAPTAEAETAERVLGEKRAAAQAEAAEQARVAKLNQQIADANKKLVDENARKIADYEAKVAAYQESLARSTAAKKEYEQKLAQNAREVQAHRDAMNTYNKEVGKGNTKGGVEVVSRLVGPFRKTREEALTALMSVSKGYPDVFDIKCERMAGNYYEEPWSCWGSYREIKTRSSVSKQ